MSLSDSRNVLSPGTKSISFSPITVAVSPASKTAQRGNLTGLPRTIRDATADLYNLIQQWNKEHIDGCTVLSKIAEAKKGQFTGGNNSSTNYFQILQPYCDLLESCYNVMVSITEKMQKISSDIQNLQKLAEVKVNCMAPLFFTWPMMQFGKSVPAILYRDGNAAQEISEAYTRELKIKKLVLNRVALTNEETALTFFVASWIHQPSLPSLTTLVEAMLSETGLR